MIRGLLVSQPLVVPMEFSVSLVHSFPLEWLWRRTWWVSDVSDPETLVSEYHPENSAELCKPRCMCVRSLYPLHLASPAAVQSSQLSQPFPATSGSRPFHCYAGGGAGGWVQWHLLCYTELHGMPTYC